MKLDVIEIVDHDDGSCTLKIDMDDQTQNALLQYAIKHILLEAVQKTIKENETR